MWPLSCESDKKMLRNNTKPKCLLVNSVILCIFLLQQIGVSAAPVENTTTVPIDDLTTEWAKQISRQAKAAEIHVMLNTKVEPCEDFYQYACGNWHRHHPAQLFNHIMTDRFQLIANAFDRRVLQVLREPRDDNVLDMKVKNFYHACELVKTDDVRYKVALQHAYHEFGKLPMLDGEDWKAEEFNWWQTVAEIQHKYGKPIILAVDIMVDIVNNTGNKVYIGPPDFSVSSGTKILQVLQEITTVEHMKRLFGVEEAKAKAVTKELIDFEHALVHGGTDARKGLTLHDLLSLKSVEDLSETYNKSLDLQHFLELALGVDQVPETVYLFDEKYLSSVVEVIAKTPPQVVANYIMWQMLQAYIVDVEKGNVAKWCVERTKKYFGKYVDYMVYQRYKDPVVEKEVIDIWEEVRESFRDDLRGNKLDWIENSTRTYALEKLDAMRLYINSYEAENFTAEYADVQITRNNYVENVQQILQMESRKKLRRQNGPVTPLEAPEVLTFTPAYNIVENTIKIPVALLQPRHFWGPHYPQALKYATLGYLIAHEMIHGFDDDGRNYDKSGSLRNWWDAKSTYQFEERRKCFQAQYHNYRYDGHQLPNDVSQAENIADNAGVKFAYKAYQRWLHTQRAANETDIDSRERFTQLNFNNEQLFFISFAQLWCDDVQSFFRTALAAADSHAPGMYRVIGALSNFQEFSWVFKCSQDAPMDPEFKCAIY
uniref:Neprilysin-2 n=1 Tax=Ceratitis capitata TaxID=7213 RepID=W8BR78_CERCA